jgi:type III restriction enzyme
MSNAFFERPILNSPYNYPARHWELGPDKQPTQRIVESRRRADFVMPIPAPKKRKGGEQTALLFDDAKEKKSTMDNYWVPGVNRLGSHGRWAFAEFTDV